LVINLYLILGSFMEGFIQKEMIQTMYAHMNK
jgi:hypothetical protein